MCTKCTQASSPHCISGTATMLIAKLLNNFIITELLIGLVEFMSMQWMVSPCPDALDSKHMYLGIYVFRFILRKLPYYKFINIVFLLFLFVVLFSSPLPVYILLRAHLSGFYWSVRWWGYCDWPSDSWAEKPWPPRWVSTVIVCRSVIESIGERFTS